MSQEKIPSDQLKAKGNEAFKKGDNEEAVKFYTQAIEIDPENAVLYSNRSGALLNLKKFKEALVDAEQCVSLKRTWGKAYSRKGHALQGLRRWGDAVKAYEEGVKQDPTVAQSFTPEIARCKRFIKATPSIAKRSGYYLLLVLHAVISINGLVSVLPLGGMAGACFYRMQKLTMGTLAIGLFQSLGRPKWSKLYARDLILNHDTHFLFCAALLLLAQPFILGVVPQMVRSSLFIANGLNHILPAISPAVFGMAQPHLQKLLANPTQMHEFNASIEVLSGFMFIAQLLTPARNIMMLFMWWQYLRMRYMLTSNTTSETKIAFNQVKVKLDGWLLGKPVIGTVYSKVQGFLGNLVDLEKQREGAGRCTVM